MASVIYVIRNPPGVLANETIDLMLVSGVFEQPTSVLFVDDGVLQLVGDGSVIGRKDTVRALKALPMYDIEKIYADAESLEQRGVSEPTEPPLQLVDSARITDLLHAHDIVITD